MKIAHYTPNKFATLFEDQLPEHTFLSNTCTEDTDIIYCGSVSQLGKALRAKKKFGKPLICWIWDIPFEWKKWCRTEKELSENKWRDPYIIQCVLNLGNCDKVISASKWTQKELKDVGINSEQMYFYFDKESIDSVKTNIRDGHVIQISRYAINKRFDITIQAMRGIDRKLVCVGYGDFSKYENLAKKLGVEVDFHSDLNREDVILLLKRSSLLVSPSIFEGWGLSPIEALYCGKPIILNDLPVFREVYGDIPIYHKSDDPLSMHLMIDSFLNNTPAIEVCEIIFEITKPIIAEFTVDKFADRWNQLIKKFVRGIKNA